MKILKKLFILSLFCVAIPTFAQNEYYTFGPDFWADKTILYDSGICPVFLTGEMFTTIVKNFLA